jgi:FkbM family methyltransferase
VSFLRNLGRRIRHLPILEQADFLWDRVRPAYHAAIGRSGHGVLVQVGGSAPVQMPPEFAGGDWESYEEASVARVASWLKDNPDALVLDIGSAVGIYSAIALAASPRTSVVAFDGDLASLAATRRMCGHVDPRRLSLVHGLLTDAGNGQPLSGAVAATQRSLISSGLDGRPGSTRYTSLLGPADNHIPRVCLDDLFRDAVDTSRPMLIKSDVEGAEMNVLKGAEELMRRCRPSMLIGVHPDALPTYGASKEAFSAFLQSHGYHTECIAIDHEEHWWCSPA